MTPAGFKITDSKGVHITFKNGWTVSIQIGPGNYCDNYSMEIADFYEKRPRSLESATAEIAFWGPDGQMQAFGDPTAEYRDTVKGYVPPEEVLHLLVDVARR